MNTIFGCPFRIEGNVRGKRVVTLSDIPLEWEELRDKRGGEAVILRSGENSLVKRYRLWNDPVYVDHQEKDATVKRLLEYQDKIFSLPDMPPEVIVPKKILQSVNGSVFGYEMEDISNAISFDEIRDHFPVDEQLYALGLLKLLVEELHQIDVVIGDFVPRDVLYKDGQIYLVDTDSLQFGDYKCESFSLGYTDPRILGFELQDGKFLPKLMKPYSKETDWYSFYGICMATLAGVDLFDGTHPSVVTKEEMVKNNIMIFEEEVSYPESALPLSEIPRKILEAIYLFTYGGDRSVLPEDEFFEF
ncbi:hypothetical protein ACFL08_05620 [Patescibacteria group bacterium]